jgi:tetratricopeptide (TPR) repeat protein
MPWERLAVGPQPADAPAQADAASLVQWERLGAGPQPTDPPPEADAAPLQGLVNRKAVVILAASLVGLFLTVHLIHGFQVKRHARDLLEEADNVERDGQVGTAVNLLHQYLALVPGDTDALARYGLLLDRQARNRRERQLPLFLLEQVLRRDSTRTAIRRKVVEIALDLQRFSDAKAHLDVLEPANPEDPDVMLWMGRWAVGARDFEMARQYYGRAVNLARDRNDVAVEFAALLRGALNNMPEAADDQIDFMVKANPRSSDARLQAARYFRQFGPLDKAENHVRFALDELGRQDAEMLLLAADVASAMGQPAEARKHLARGWQLYPKDTRIAQALVPLEMAEGNRAQALVHLDECLKATGANPEQQLNLANLCVDLREPERARVVLKRLEKQGNTSASLFLQARLLVDEQAWGKARELLEKVRARGLTSKTD